MSSAIEKVVLTPLRALGRIPDLIRSGRSSSMVDYTKATRCEPITLVSRDLTTYANISDILQAAVSIYSGFYLQSIAIATNVGRVDVLRKLDKVNPSRDPIEAGGLWLDGIFSGESFQLPGLSTGKQKYSLESFRDVEEEASSTTFDRNSVDIATASSSLSVGKVFNVELISAEGQRATMPVSVRLFVIPMEQEIFLNLLTHASKDNSIKERFYGIKSGRLEFIKDGIFCRDLIREHRKMIMKDKSGQYQDILHRANKNRLAGLVSLEPSVATSSNIAVITKQEQLMLEGMIGGKLKDSKVRKRIFDNSYLMLMIVVDDSFDVVTIYYDGIEQSTQLSVRDIKAMSKGKDIDVAEITRMLMMSQAPSY